MAQSEDIDRRSQPHVNLDASGNKYALAVGVNRYSDPSLPNLRYCKNDATVVVETLTSRCDFTAHNVKTLLDGKAKRKDMLESLACLRDEFLYPNPSLIVFYFAGHGLSLDGRNYLAPSDGSVGRAATEHNVSLEAIVDALVQTGCPRIVVILDACRCALSSRHRASFLGFDEEAARAIAASATGLKIIFAAEFGKPAFEDPVLEHGVFTHYLIQGLRGEAVDADGLITVGSVSRYLHNSLTVRSRADSHSTQIPQTAGEGSDQIVIAHNADVPNRFSQACSDLVFLGNKLLVERKYNDSRTLFKSLTHLNDGDFGAHFGLGCSAAFLEDFEEARNAFLKANSLDPTNAVAVLNLGSTHMGLRQWETALNYFSHVLDMAPRSVDALIRTGGCLNELGRPAEALKSLEQAAKLSPSNEQVPYNRGISFQQLRQYKRAITEYSKALDLNASYPQALNNLGNCYYSVGRVDESIIALEKALLLNPDLREAHANLGRILTGKGEHAKALFHLERALQLGIREPLVLGNRALSLHELGRTEEALPDWDEAIRLQPDRAQLYYDRGVGLMKLGRFAAAVESYGSCLELSPNYASALGNIAICYFREGNSEEAKKKFQECMMKSTHGSAVYERARLSLKTILDAGY